jgi:DNA ligase D-like protein (predicted 3'-phosphoesterase)
VPKGPSTDPGDKRLAIPTEDHPVEYADFKGEIPDGEYGAGQVYIWDKGTFEDLKSEEDGRTPQEHYEEGKIEVKLHGSKLTGNFALTKMKNKKEWLLVKMKE